MASPRPGIRLVATTSLLAVCLANCLTGCALPQTGLHASIDDNPRSLIDGYLIARGMALSYGHSGRAGPAEINELIRYDRAALVAVASATLQPGSTATARARQAVGAMVRYTGEQDLKPLPAPNAVAD